MDTTGAVIIGVAVGIILGAVPVYHAWQAENDARARTAAMRRHPAGTGQRLTVVTGGRR